LNMVNLRPCRRRVARLVHTSARME
jgi:hypothetical protein